MSSIGLPLPFTSIKTVHVYILILESLNLRYEQCEQLAITVLKIIQMPISQKNLLLLCQRMFNLTIYSKTCTVVLKQSGNQSMG